MSFTEYKFKETLEKSDYDLVQEALNPNLERIHNTTFYLLRLQKYLCHESQLKGSSYTFNLRQKFFKLIDDEIKLLAKSKADVLLSSEYKGC